MGGTEGGGLSPKPVPLPLSGPQAVRLGLGIHLGTWVMFSNTSRAKWSARMQWGPHRGRASAERPRVCPTEVLGGSGCPGAAGRDRAEASGLRLHCGSHMTCHHMTAEGTPPPTGPLPTPSLLPPWLPPGFCCICLDSNPLGAASFSTLFQLAEGRTKSRRNNKQPYFLKLALLEAWTLPDHRPRRHGYRGLGLPVEPVQILLLPLTSCFCLGK